MICVMSGGSGATLVVTGVAGETCTITNGTKTYTKTFGTDKKATFKGLATGTWTVKMTNGSKTSTRTITITADYALTIAYFSATIKVTYPAKSKAVIKNSSGTQIAWDENSGTSAKTWTATVGASGTYTVVVTATDGSSKTKTTTASITADGQSVSVSLSYDYIIFSNETGLNSAYSDGGGGCKVTVSTDSSGKKISTYPADGYSRMAYLKPPTDLTEYSAIKISGYVVGSQERYFGVWSKVPQEYDPSVVAKVIMSGGTAPTSYTIDISSLSGSYYLAPQYAVNDTIIYDLRLE